MMDGLDDAKDYRRAAQLKDTSGQRMAHATKHMHEAANHRLLQTLLARFLLLDLLVEETRKIGSLPTDAHRRLWVLLQVQPEAIFKKVSGFDIFMALSELLRPISVEDLKSRIRNAFVQLSPLLSTETLFCVLDESQIAATKRYGEFVADDGTSPRPLLKEIYQSWTTVLPADLRLVFSGTGIELDAFQSVLGSSAFKAQPYDLISDIGAFEDPESQMEYIKRYVQVDWSEPQWEHFLRRAWAWARGRYYTFYTASSMLISTCS
jgi:hypothetical protein